jgi:hypothetical protein
MAHIELEADRVSMQLSLLDEVLAMHGSLHIPYRHITAVHAGPVPEAWFRGFRIGTNIPGVKVAGSFYNGDGVVFYDFHDPARCLTLETTHERYQRVVVEVDHDQDPVALAQQVAARLQRN